MSQSTQLISLAERARTSGRRVVLLHIGEAKTGTTFLQDVMWSNRATLRAHGIHLPGHHSQDQYRASRDLREVAAEDSDPRGTWRGEWDLLARQAASGTGVAVISQEILMTASPEQVRRAVESLQPAEVHVALTVRNLGAVLPADWQEFIKNRGVTEWDTWLRVVLDRKAKRASPLRRRFWRLHGTLSTIGKWSEVVSAANMHIVPVPAAGAAPGLLWERWADLLGVDPHGYDTSVARPNRSLGFAESEFLRAVNKSIAGDVPLWFYESYVKPSIAEGVLAAAPSPIRPQLDEAARTWVARYERKTVDTIATLGLNVWGELEDLVTTFPDANTATPPTDAQLAGVGVESVAQLIRRRLDQPLPDLPRPAHGDRSRFMTWIASSTRAKRAVRELSARHRAVASARVAVWRMSNRLPGRRRSDRL